MIDAITSAERVLLAPSNPITSIGPILAVPGIPKRCKQAAARSPQSAPSLEQSGVGTRWIFSWPHRACPFPSPVWLKAYKDFLDILIVDIVTPGLPKTCGNPGCACSAPNRHEHHHDKAALAREVLVVIADQGCSAEGASAGSAAHAGSDRP